MKVKRIHLNTDGHDKGIISKVGFILSQCRDDANITICRNGNILTDHTPKTHIDFKHYSRMYRQVFTADFKPIGESLDIIITVY